MVLAKRPNPSKKKKNCYQISHFSILRSTCHGFLSLESKRPRLKKQYKSHHACFIYSNKWFSQFIKINTINVIIGMSIDHKTKILYNSKFQKKRGLILQLA